MRIAVASGKGGTGKTMLATGLALSLAQAGSPPLFLDCDVEAPNAHLCLLPAWERRQEVGLLVPDVDEERCTYCGRCTEVCQYHAIAVLGGKVLVFPQLCHGCGSCARLCPEQAIRERLEVLGSLEAGRARGGILYARGVLQIGQPMAVPVIRQLKKWVEPESDRVVIVDAPPGTSCPVVETLRGADFVLLVSEPTPFGLHDLRLAAEVVRELNLPAGIVLNRDGLGDSEVDSACTGLGFPVLMRIPFERAIAEGIAQGRCLPDIHPAYRASFLYLFGQICEIVAWRNRSNETTRNLEW